MSENFDFINQFENILSLNKLSNENINDLKIKINWYSSIYNMHMYWTKQKPEVVASYINRFCPKGGTVLDAFAGSGMTGVAALMSGRNVILSDLSPLCNFLCENFTSKVDLSEITSRFTRITKEISNKFKWLYQTCCHSCGNQKAQIYAVIWVDNFTCPECNHVQSMCLEGAHLKLKKGDTIKNISCRKCSTIYAKKMKYFHSSSPITIEVDCAVCGKAGKENARTPTKTDKRWLKKINNYKIKTFYPAKIKFPLGINTKRCLLRKIRHPYQIFSKMNLIYLSAYWTFVKRDYENGEFSKSVQDKLLFIATSAMFHGSLMRRWLPYRTGVPLKGTLFVPSMSEDVRFSRVLEHQALRVFRGQSSINEIARQGNVKTKLSSALDLRWIPDNSVDYLYYDPPFGGHINYSELNLVWEAWLGKTTDTNEEIIVNRHQNKTMEDYGHLLREAIAEAVKKLKFGGYFTIVFAHSDLKVWRILQEAVSGLSLKVQGAPEILDSANKTFIQCYSNRAQQNMITFTFKKTRKNGQKLNHDFKKKVETEINRFFKRNPIGIKREDIFDHITRALFSTSFIESFNLDSYLAKNYTKKGNLWAVREFKIKEK
jgi:DNA modification methylase